MSENENFSIWSNDEIELLDKINEEFKLGSSDSETDSNKLQRSDGESWKVFQKNDRPTTEEIRQSIETNHSPHFLNQKSNISLDKLKLHFSSNDLSKLTIEDKKQIESVPNNVISFHDLMSYDRSCPESREPSSVCDVASPKEYKIMDVRESDKRDYLEEINNRLMRELDEKNALLTKLQENYENLLLKYAEAQNKIDQLRLKTVCDNGDCHIHANQNYQKGNINLPVKIFPNSEHHDAWEDVKCQKAVVAPFMKDDYQKSEAKKIDRPSSLPLEPKAMEMDAVKAGTPTDSEGVSSVITSMSGHSKILNTLDVHSPNSRDSKLINYSERDFILNDNSVVNDAFNKVKDWQNSLPPLELIETPETTLYDESPVQISPFIIPKEGNNDESEYSEIRNELNYAQDDPSRTGFKDYLRNLTLPNDMRKNMKKRSGDKNQDKPKEDVPSSCIIQRRKKPPLLRCSSLPAYDYDSPKSGSRGVYVPPLDLENLTLSDVESSQTEYLDYGKPNRLSSSSYITSQSGSMEFSSQTYRSKGRLMEYSDPPCTGRACFSKSTSITPDRCNDFSPFVPESKSLCRVCGEKLPERSFPCRSNSYQSFQEVNDAGIVKSVDKRGKYPFNRSVSFNSETGSLRRCYHTQDCFLRRRNDDTLEKFDIYANNLKARSQVVMKALAAHVNNT